MVMYDFFLQFTEPQFLIMVLSAVAAFATVATFMMTALTGDKLGARLKYVSSEREKMRAERLTQLADENRQARLRNKPKGFMKQIVEQLNLSKLLETESTREKLKMAGLRGQAPVVAFLFLRLILPFVTFVGAFVYLYLLGETQVPPVLRLAISLGAGVLIMRKMINFDY